MQQCGIPLFKKIKFPLYFIALKCYHSKVFRACQVLIIRNAPDGTDIMKNGGKTQ